MLGKDYANQHCSAARALEIAGERWSLLILRDAMFRDFSLFSDSERSLGIAPNVLARRLESFVAAGLMRIEGEGGRTDDRRYRVTGTGREFAAVMMALGKAGERWGSGRLIDAFDGGTSG